MVVLRPFQTELVADIRSAYISGYSAPLVQLPTGGGKTTIFCYATAESIKKGTVVFLIAHRAELVKQISMTLARFGVYHRVIAPAKIINQCETEHQKNVGQSFVDKTARAVVASVQTLARRLDPLELQPGLIIVDEAHHLTRTSQWGAVVSNYPRAKLLLVSATPCRLDGQGLGRANDGFADVILNGPPMRWLIDNGFLCEFRAFAPPVEINLSTVKKVAGDYEKKSLAEVMDRPTITGDVVNHYEALTPGKRAVVFTCNRKHADNVEDEFNAAGIPAAVLDGTLDPDTRAEIIAKFERGDLLVLATIDVVSEGFDLPAIEVAILLRPTASLSLYLQQVGRVLRLAAGKSIAIILDHVGAFARHGWPDDEREWTLSGVKKSKNQTGGVTVTTCENCFAIYKGGAAVCPECGKIKTTTGRKIKTVAGVLVELSREEKAAEREQKKQDAAAEAKERRKQEGRARTFDDFLALAIARGYQYPQQWAEKRIKFKKSRK